MSAALALYEGPAFSTFPKLPKTKRKLVDLFCGAGGTTCGYVRAFLALGIEHEVTVVNHWSTAIRTHRANFPHAHHICNPLEDVCPTEAVKGHIHHLHASPECTHHSKAAGGRPKNPQSRATAMWVIRWAWKKLPDVITVENVVEFVTWGVLDKNGRPIKELAGKHFQRWLRCLEKLGYKWEYRILNAADYGDPTRRKRFILMARRDGIPIEFPKQTNVKPQEKVRRNLNLPAWNPARSHINLEDKGTSIFRRKKPLAAKTIDRIARSLEKLGGAAAEPFLLVLRNNVDFQSLDEPIYTITGGGNHYGLVEPMVIQYRKGEFRSSIDEPILTITGTPTFGFCQFLIKYHAGKDKKGRSQSLEDPIATLDTSNRFGLVETSVQMLLPHQKFAIDSCDDIDLPHRTIDATNARCNRVVEATIKEIQSFECGEQFDLFGDHVDLKGFPIILETEDAYYGLDITLRMLRNHELAGLMGFPPDYKFEGTTEEITRQIGNAVPVGLSTAIGLAVYSPWQQDFQVAA